MSAAPVPSRPRRPWAEPARPRLRNLLLAVPLFLSTGAASAEGLSGAEATAFLAQSVCLDGAGAPIPGRLPFEPGCDRRRPARIEEVLPWRKTDFPDSSAALARPQGYMASDAVVGRLLGRPAIIQTFDIGGGFQGHEFGRFEPDEGGQAALLSPGPNGVEAGFVVTQDGGRPGVLQWFLSPACRPGAPPAPAWLAFAGEVPDGRWAERIAPINIAAAPNACPRDFGRALTRWRRARIALPMRWHDDPTPRSLPVETIVSEHYARPEIVASDHLERFWFARDLGMVRWERWNNGAFLADTPERGRWFARTGRCGPVPFSESPGPGWALVDCRTWTNFSRQGGRVAPWPLP